VIFHKITRGEKCECGISGKSLRRVTISVANYRNPPPLGFMTKSLASEVSESFKTAMK
jgi:hypothetical protein